MSLHRFNLKAGVRFRYKSRIFQVDGVEYHGAAATRIEFVNVKTGELVIRPAAQLQQLMDHEELEFEGDHLKWEKV